MCSWFRRRPDISIIVPFRDNGEHRTRVWQWLHEYYREALPDAEILVGEDDSWPFSKTRAVNSAAKRARGKIFVILDADALIQPEKLRQVCDDLILDRRLGKRTWAVPYTSIYYLNEPITLAILEVPPKLLVELDFEWPSPPLENWREGDRNPLYGHPYGAMCMVMPREAFYCINGMDPRFQSWGGEDLACLTSLDTLWGLHTVYDHDIQHMYHVRPGSTANTRRWPGQPDYGFANGRLAHKYMQASGEVPWMRALADEHKGAV